MTAYEFIKNDVSVIDRKKVDLYDADMLVSILEKVNSGKNLREQKEYRDAWDSFIDCTMSCDRGEAIGWMRYWMGKAIAYGLETKRREWGYFFLAAYDLRRDLMRG